MVDWRSSFAIGSFSKAMSPCLAAIFPPYEDTTLKIMIVGDLRPLLSPRRLLPYGTARTTPLPSCGDPARVRRRGQTALAGGPETPDTMARRWLGADDRPGRRASQRHHEESAKGARAGCLVGETQRPRARGRPVRPAARGARGCGE